MRERIQNLENHLGYHFKDINLLELAFTHRSFSKNSYERLEFLGDNVLGLIISEYLFNTFSKIKEGKLSRIRSHLVCGTTLANISQKLGLMDYVSIGNMPIFKVLPESIQADLLESIIGAIYLDSNLETCQKVVMKWFKPIFETLDPDDVFKDSKTQLQEWLQAHNQKLPVYYLEKISGEEHKQMFHIVCSIEFIDETTKATGKNRRQGEQKSAKKMYELLSSLKIENINDKN